MTKMVNLDRFKRDLPSPATSSGKSIPKPWRGGLSGSFFLWLQIPSLKTRSHYERMSNLLTIVQYMVFLPTILLSHRRTPKTCNKVNDIWSRRKIWCFMIDKRDIGIRDTQIQAHERQR